MTVQKLYSSWRWQWRVVYGLEAFGRRFVQERESKVKKGGRKGETQSKRNRYNTTLLAGMDANIHDDVDENNC